MIDQTAQRTMQVPGQGLIPQGRPTIDYKEYPKMMTHPQYQPGKPGPEVKSPHGFSYHVGGTPIRFPPVLVKTPDDEEYHKSMGYESQGKCDAAAFARAVGAGQIPDHVAYKPLEYPKWVHGKLIHSREEEDRLFRPETVLVTQEGSSEPALNTEVATLLDRPDIAGPPEVDTSQHWLDETTEQKRARLLRHLAELDGVAAAGPTMEQLRIEDLESKVDQLTMLLATALKRQSDPAQPAKPAKKAATPKKPRKMPALTEAQKQSRSDAIKAGLARKRALTESAQADEVPESQRS